ncbi:MAG: site-specific DNA-methyltransferase, partial [Alphaproteobacteria bacterium HGW-Alphaproteobacteria-8]
EPEQVRAFRDTWKDGIHSYLTYLRDRLTVARDLLSDSGSIFVQIGDENVHRVRALMDEVFGVENLVAQITIEKTSSQTQDYLPPVTDYVLWYGRDKSRTKYRDVWRPKSPQGGGFGEYTRIERSDLERRPMLTAERSEEQKLPSDAKVYRQDNLTSQSAGREKGEGAASWFPVNVDGLQFRPSMQNRWKTSEQGMQRMNWSRRIEPRGTSLSYVRFFEDFPVMQINNVWRDVKFSSRSEDKTYVVQTSAATIARCILMTTDPGDLVLDPTCGSGTTAYVAEQWGRRWITIDTSRVAIALARSRLMGARYPYYLLADSKDGQVKEADVTRSVPKSTPTFGNIRHGFVYDRVPHITLKSIANNAEIDVIWDRMQPAVDVAVEALNTALSSHATPFKVETGGRAGVAIDFRATGEVKLPSGEPAPAGGLMEWEIPREAPSGWPATAQSALKTFWTARITRQREIDASIAAKAEFEFLYDKPFADSGKTRVAGPFTVESLSPHRTLAVDWDDELIDTFDAAEGRRKKAERGDSFTDFAHMILENLKAAGVQQAHKEDRITFTSLKGWPGNWIAAEGTFMEGDTQRRAGVFIGPEFGTVSRPDLVAAAREAGDAGFDVLIACAFNYDAHSSE